MSTPALNKGSYTRILQHVKVHNTKLARKSDTIGRTNPDKLNKFYTAHLKCLEVICFLYQGSIWEYEKTGLPIVEHRLFTNNVKIAEKMECSTTSVFRYITKLVKAGFITKRNRGWIIGLDGKRRYRDYELTINPIMLNIIPKQPVLKEKSTSVDNQYVNPYKIASCNHNNFKINNITMLSESANADNNNLKISEKVEGGVEPANSEATQPGINTQGERSGGFIVNAMWYAQILWFHCYDKIYSKYKFIAPSESKYALNTFYQIFVQCKTPQSEKATLNYWIEVIDRAKSITKRTPVSKHKKDFEIPLPSIYFNLNNSWGVAKVQELMIRDKITEPEREIKKEYQLAKYKRQLLVDSWYGLVKEKTTTRYNLTVQKLYKNNPDVAINFTKLVQCQKEVVFNKL